MIIPTKHTNFSESLLGLGSYILERLIYPKSVDELWMNYKNDLSNGQYHAIHDFDNFILAIIFLYSINIIDENNGVIYKCN